MLRAVAPFFSLVGELQSDCTTSKSTGILIKFHRRVLSYDSSICRVQINRILNIIDYHGYVDQSNYYVYLLTFSACCH